MKTHLEDGILDLNQPSINKEVLSILKVLNPTLRPNDVRYYSAHRLLDWRWSLFVRGKKYLTYDRHHGQGDEVAIQDYLSAVRTLVRFRLLQPPKV